VSKIEKNDELIKFQAHFAIKVFSESDVNCLTMFFTVFGYFKDHFSWLLLFYLASIHPTFYRL